MRISANIILNSKQGVITFYKQRMFQLHCMIGFNLANKFQEKT